jgi:hypothetical protein
MAFPIHYHILLFFFAASLPALGKAPQNSIGIYTPSVRMCAYCAMAALRLPNDLLLSL